jgi:hypothetical protein
MPADRPPARGLGLCQVCALVPAREGLGFPTDPRLPVPDHLRGATLWTCGAAACIAAARARARAAARRASVPLARVIRF